MGYRWYVMVGGTETPAAIEECAAADLQSILDAWSQDLSQDDLPDEEYTRAVLPLGWGWQAAPEEGRFVYRLEVDPPPASIESAGLVKPTVVGLVEVQLGRETSEGKPALAGAYLAKRPYLHRSQAVHGVAPVLLAWAVAQSKELDLEGRVVLYDVISKRLTEVYRACLFTEMDDPFRDDWYQESYYMENTPESAEEFLSRWL